MSQQLANYDIDCSQEFRMYNDDNNDNNDNNNNNWNHDNDDNNDNNDNNNNNWNHDNHDNDELNFLVKIINNDINSNEFPWERLAHIIQNMLLNESSHQHPLYKAYANLLSDCKVNYFPDENEYTPYKNGIHFLLHILYRAESGSSKITRKVLEYIILILKSLRLFGWIKPEYIEEIPANRDEITDYDAAIPRFAINAKNLLMFVAKNHGNNKQSNDDNDDISDDDDDDDISDDDDDDDTSDDDDYSDDDGYEFINNNQHFNSNYNIKELYDDNNNTVWIEECKMYDFNPLHYGNYIKCKQKFFYFSPLEFIAWFALIPAWCHSLDSDFILYDETKDKQRQKNIFCMDQSNKNLYALNACADDDDDDALHASTDAVSKFVQTTFVSQHLTYEKEYVFELSNGAMFYKNCLISTDNDIRTNTLYYIVDVKFNESEDKLLEALQNQNQTQITNMSIDCIMPEYILIVHKIKQTTINDTKEWYFDTLNAELQISPNKCDKHIRRVFDFDYNDIKFELSSDGDLVQTNIHISPPQEQHELVKNHGMFFFMQWAADGVTYNWNQESMTNSLIHVINNKLGKQANNLWRMACAPKCIPQRFIIHTLCEEISKLRDGFVIWKCGKDMKSFEQDNCAGTLALVVTDTLDRNKLQLSVSSSKRNKIDGRTFINAYNNGMPYPKNSNLRQFGIKIPYQWKDYFHTLVHETINKRLKGEFATKRWKNIPRGIITKGCGITAVPWKIWNDWDGNKFDWNFLSCGIVEFYHITASSMITRLFEHTYKSFRHPFLKENYQCLMKHIYANNNCLKDYKLANFDKLTVENNMSQQYGKWFYTMISLPYLVDFSDGVSDLIQLIRLVSRIILCNNEHERQLIHKQSTDLFEHLKNEYADNVNTPKFRLLKETIDLDLFLFNNISIIEGLYSEHGHQFTKKLKQNRSNHTKTNLEDLLNFLSVNYGLVYLINGGHYGPNLQYCLGPAARNLKHPDDPSKPHPLIEEFLFTTKHENTVNPDDVIKISIHKQLFIQNVSALNAIQLEYFWYHWINNNKFDQFKQFVPETVNNENVYNINCCKNLYLNDGKKSNSVIFNYSKYHSIFDDKTKDWNYWFKIYDHNNNIKIVNIELIFQITSNTDDNFCKILGYGTMFNITPALFYNDYCHHSEYTDFIDTFNMNEPLNSKWFLITKKKLIESVVIVHNHIPSEKLQTNYKHSFVDIMREYFDDIQQEDTLNVPCGPILQCIRHKKINCSASQCILDRSYTKKWFCNTQKQNEFLIYDSKNGWLPGIWHQNHQTLDAQLVA